MKRAPFLVLMFRSLGNYQRTSFMGLVKASSLHSNLINKSKCLNQLKKTKIFRWRIRQGSVLERETGLIFNYIFSRYGLYVNSDLMNGNSYPCDTFDNVSLSHQIDFRILELELWGLDEECANMLKMLTIKKSLFTN